MIERYKTLRAIRDFGAEPFTVEQLVERSGVNINTVRTILRRDEPFVDEVGTVKRPQRGAAPKLFRLRPSASAELSAALADVEAITLPPSGVEGGWVPDGSNVPKVSMESNVPTELLAAEKILLSLAVDERDRADELVLARLGLATGAEVMATAESDGGPELVAHVAAVEALLALAELEDAWSTQSATNEVGDQVRALMDAAASALADAAPDVVAALEKRVAASPASELLVTPTAEIVASDDDELAPLIMSMLSKYYPSVRRIAPSTELAWTGAGLRVLVTDSEHGMNADVVRAFLTFASRPDQRRIVFDTGGPNAALGDEAWANSVAYVTAREPTEEVVIGAVDALFGSHLFAEPPALDDLARRVPARREWLANSAAGIAGLFAGAGSSVLPTTAITIGSLLEAGVHFGHQTSRWNPKMRRFIFTERQGIYVIDLQQTLEAIDEAGRFAEDVAARGGTILFVGTKKSAQDAVEREAKRIGMPYVNHRWFGGLLTNWQGSAQRIERLHDLRRLHESQQVALLPTSERLALERELAQLEQTIGGVADMHRQPDAIFVVDVDKEDLAVREARRIGVPVIALVDTNGDPDEADFVIPGNDDAIRSCALIVHAFADAVARGQRGSTSRHVAQAARSLHIHAAHIAAAEAAAAEEAAVEEAPEEAGSTW